MVAALAVIYVMFAGPFWQLINSDMHYLDQFKFIQPMHDHMKEMVRHPELLLKDVPDDLAAFRLQDHHSPTISATMCFAQNAADRPLLLGALSLLAEHFVMVIERQLADFLPDGKYGREPTPEDRDRMKHCQLTNLLGEACFADMDFSMFKSRRATLHHHSTMNMLKRNRTVTSFLNRQTSAQQACFLEQARKLAQQVRQAHKEQVRQVQTSLNALMEEQKRTKAVKQAKKLENKKKLLETIEHLGGSCKTQEDVLQLLSRQHN
ncbi:hypothetical protein BaRGS_00019440 [Batillaria attramentaria]|uniref:Uncharacterized protein n=1 Tax=Batillaria attramentaria TaxID=370345 RepID=A0ABD0KQ40_9CAEN